MIKKTRVKPERKLKLRKGDIRTGVQCVELHPKTRNGKNKTKKQRTTQDTPVAQLPHNKLPQILHEPTQKHPFHHQRASPDTHAHNAHHPHRPLQLFRASYRAPLARFFDWRSSSYHDRQPPRPYGQLRHNAKPPLRHCARLAFRPRRLHPAIPTPYFCRGKTVTPPPRFTSTLHTNFIRMLYRCTNPPRRAKHHTCKSTNNTGKPLGPADHRCTRVTTLLYWPRPTNLAPITKKQQEKHEDKGAGLACAKSAVHDTRARVRPQYAMRHWSGSDLRGKQPQALPASAANGQEPHA